MVSTTAEGRAHLALADRSSAEVVAMSEPTEQTGSDPVVGPDWDAPSWDDVVRDHGARVYRLAYRLTGNQHDAEDLTQEVFVRVFRSLSQYTPGSFEGWLHRITTNLFLDQVRRKARIRAKKPELAVARRLLTRIPAVLRGGRPYSAAHHPV